jgi:bifunctional DNA-binding transcriptional regulator/antitoxin component of YhaV-PrlF toxin-antitoxin module
VPQLVKGGKHAFGWSRVGDAGRIVIPPEALEEYRLEESEKVILVPGSQTSGGFGLGSLERVSRSRLGVVVDGHSQSEEFRESEGEVIEYGGKPHCWVRLQGGGVTVPPGTLERYGVRVGDPLLVIRGSGLAVGFAVRGPIVEEAEKHRELEVFEPGV